MAKDKAETDNPREERNCPCQRCSWGFCHFCDAPDTNTVVETPRGYRYRDGCGLRTLTSKGHLLQASACEAHLKPKEDLHATKPS